MQNKRITTRRTIVWLDIENLLRAMFPGQRLHAGLDMTPLKKALRHLTDVAAIYAYGDFFLLSRIFRCDVEQMLRRLGIVTHHLASIRGKNSADMAIVTAIHIALAEQPDLTTVVIGSGDGDFRPVAAYARSLGKEIVLIAPFDSLSRQLKGLAHRMIYLDGNFSTTIKNQRQTALSSKYLASRQ